MKKFTRVFKGICLFMILRLCIFGEANAQVIYHEGFEGETWAGKTVNFSKSQWLLLPGGFNSYRGDVCAYVTTDSYDEPADCWLITDPVNFEAGKKYSISFHYKCQTNQENQLQVSVGNNLTTSGGKILWDQTFHNDNYLKGQINFTASASGKQRVGFHCISSPTMVTYLYFDELTVEEVTCFEPLNIAFTNTTSTSTVAGWDKVDGAEYYEYSVLENDTSNPRKIFKVSTNSVTLKNLPVASSDYLYVRSRCSATDSSNWATAKYSTNYDCSTFPTLNCGVKIKQNYRGGTGLYPVKLCDQYINGPEFFHKFTATQNGYYKLDCFSSGGNGIPVSFSYKPSSDGCGNSNWNCIGVMGDYNTGIFGPLKAGEEYIIMEKSELEAKLPSTYTFEVECYNPPPANDNYKNATAITVSDYNENCIGTAFTTTGATPDNLGPNDYNSCGAYANSNDDDIWIKFKATDNVQLFRFSDVTYTDAPLLELNFYSSPSNPDSLIDCGEIKTGEKDKDIISYYFTKGKTYWCRISTIGIDNSARFKLCIMKPAVAVSTVDTCNKGLRLQLQYKDNNVWVPMLNKSLQLIGEVNYGDNTNSAIVPFVLINHGDLRQDETGRYYLDRNFNVISRPKIKTPINVRLYITNDELNKLTDQKGSQVNGIKGIRVTQIDDGMCSPLNNKTGTFIVPDKTGDYDATHKYIEFKTDHLSSFFLHGGNTALNSAATVESDATATTLNSGVKVSPNPFTSIVTIETSSKAFGEYNISVISASGKTIVIYKKVIAAGDNKITLNLGTLSSGIYMLKIENKNSTQFKKIIKQ